MMESCLRNILGINLCLFLYNMKYIALEFFSGIGGLHTALKQVSPESFVVCSYDINPNAYLV